MPEFSVFDIHTRRPYKAKPALEKIRLYNHPNDDGSWNTTLLFDSARALARFKTLLTHPGHGDSEASQPENSGDVVPLKRLYEIILTIHEQMNEDSLGFIEKVFDRSSNIVNTRLQPQNEALSYGTLGCAQPRSPRQGRIPLSAHVARLCHFNALPYSSC